MHCSSWYCDAPGRAGAARIISSLKCTNLKQQTFSRHQWAQLPATSESQLRLRLGLAARVRRVEQGNLFNFTVIPGLGCRLSQPPVPASRPKCLARAHRDY